MLWRHARVGKAKTTPELEIRRVVHPHTGQDSPGFSRTAHKLIGGSVRRFVPEIHRKINTNLSTRFHYEPLLNSQILNTFVSRFSLTITSLRYCCKSVVNADNEHVTFSKSFLLLQTTIFLSIGFDFQEKATDLFLKR